MGYTPHDEDLTHEVEQFHDLIRTTNIKIDNIICNHEYSDTYKLKVNKLRKSLLKLQIKLTSI